jgi:hypothetical protein
MLLVEFDPLDPDGAARVCLVWGTHGQLDVSFPDLSPVADVMPFIHGLRIRAEF